ncbi:Protein NRT1/ PTR FAMILY 2.8 [Raphanus sativus]|uniref:Protein NRT1/ PTR FAMILY 2.8-like n=1 Tax=Raphanus sativus TaxID=3726 RepID=A0A9W3BWU0_RAPSA|nr:protein NRT1/ PTR FAMILY 2.8-like [Raphanus sativus]KAJ4888041.1 Protein NRT1/ PTR FAMILY 2.8 [Raphanus sativus]
MDIESSTTQSPHVHQESTNQDPLIKHRGGWRAIKYIIANESFEKLASMSLIGNLSVYLTTKYNLGGIFLVNIINIWFGSCNFLSIPGAFVSDAYLGRFWTLLLGSISSFLGMGIIALTAALPRLRPEACKDPTNCSNPPERWQLAVLFAGLGLVAIGAGGIRPCNIAFGADQFDTSTTKGKSNLETFFNWWYFSFTVALVIALTGVVYIQTNISWAIGFMIPTACLALSITTFLIGQHTYICAEPKGSVFADMVKVVAAACKKRKVKSGEGVTFYLGSSKDGSSTTLVQNRERLRFVEKAAVITDPNELNEEGKAKNNWRLCSVEQVKNLKCVTGILPVWVTGIACFMLTDQQNIYGILQAIQMEKTFGHNFQVPAGWMNLISMITLAVWISLYECVILPIASLITGRKQRLTMKQRIQIGIVMGIVCMLVAGFLEKSRRAAALKKGSFVSPVSIVMLLPQFMLAGLTEAFSAVALMEFLTVKMPEHMRAVAGAIFFLSSSIASYICTLLIIVIDSVTRKEGRSWLGDKDLNKNRLEYYFFIIGGVQAVNLLYFRFFASRFITENNEDNEIFS